jgi:hypothetical protein
VSTPANDYLLRTGHNNGGRCEKCWTEAAWLYAGGQGEYESHTAAYYAVMDKHQTAAIAATEQREGTWVTRCWAWPAADAGGCSRAAPVPVDSWDAGRCSYT